GHQNAVRLAASLPGGAGLLSVADDAEVRVWDAAGREVRRFDLGDEAHCFCAALAPGGKQLAVGDWHALRPVGWATGKEVRRLKGHERQTWTVAYFPDGKRLASIAHLDRCIRLWELGGGKELRVIRTRHQNGPQCLAVSPDGRTLATGGEFDHTVCLWDPADGKLLRQWQAHQGGRGRGRGGGGLRFSPDRQTPAPPGAAQTVRPPDPGA